jgi:lipopolysaccharide transport system ATP-binding protein
VAKEVCESYLEAFYEAQQGKSTTTRIKVAKSNSVGPLRDQRQDFINASNLRNDIQIFDFDPEAPSFGQGAAQITDVKLLDKAGNPLAWIVGGEDVVLQVEVITRQLLDSPIVGFYIKDKLGQNLFGDNTFLSYFDKPVLCESDNVLKAEFSFQMPRLAPGDYSITVAIANGTQDVHVQHHWIHDAVFFKSESTSVAGGLIGIPMSDIRLHIEEK